jgi:hypothetical protein
MKPVLVGIWIALTAGLAGAAPARLHYEPQKREAPPIQGYLHDTTWTGKCFGMECLITFKADGTLDYQSGNLKANARNYPGFWRISNDLLFFEINKYSEHRGVITGNTIQGDSSNKEGSQSKFRLDRFPTP